jgi:ABC-type glycerol-3-phosphate transport system substrate-binding protein
MVIALAGCFSGEAPVPPREALAKAGQRIDELLKEEHARGGEAAAPEPAQTPEDPHEVWFWYYAHPLISPVMLRGPERQGSFAARCPNVKLKPQYIGDWSVAIQKLVVSLAAGDLPDIAVVKRSWLARLIPSGRIVPVDQVVPASLIEDFCAPSRNALTVNGHLYAAPADGFCSVLFYNREIIQDAPPATWEDLHRRAREITQSNPEMDPIGDMPFPEALWSANGEVCSETSNGLTSQPAFDALDFLLSLRQDGRGVFLTVGVSSFSSPPTALRAFLAGRVAMTVASSEYWPEAQRAKFSVAMAPIPGKTGPISMLSDNAIVVFARYAEAKRDAIAAVMDFLTGPDFQGPGSVPTRSSVAKDCSIPDGLQRAYAHARNTPLIPLWGAIELELARCLDLASRWKPTQ